MNHLAVLLITGVVVVAAVIAVLELVAFALLAVRFLAAVATRLLRRPSISRARAPRLDTRVVPGRPAAMVGAAERGPGSIYLSSSWRAS